jgi:hypothetical protein
LFSTIPSNLAGLDAEYPKWAKLRFVEFSLGVVALANVFADLRAKYFGMPRPEEVPPPASPDEPWAAVMEIAYPQSTLTAVALSDGTARVLRSTGGGFFSAGVVEAVRPAAEAFIREARRQNSTFTPASEFPQPEVGQVFFYTRSDARVCTAATAESELSSQTHSLSQLYFAGLRILHEFLQLQKARSSDSS